MFILPQVNQSRVITILILLQNHQPDPAAALNCQLPQRRFHVQGVFRFLVRNHSPRLWGVATKKSLQPHNLEKARRGWAAETGESTTRRFGRSVCGLPPPPTGP